MITHEFRNVNSNKLVQELADFIDDLMDAPSYLYAEEYHREAITDVAFEIMKELQDAGNVTNYKIVGDNRINTNEDYANGTFRLDIHFKQHNCYNTTKLRFIQTKSVDEII
jgi:hypothetical protein